MGFFPDWLKHLDWRDFFRSVKEDAQKIPKIVGDIVSGTTKPILSGVRSAFTPTLIWLLVFIIIGLIIFKNYKKILNI
ncbi:hypothetical protein ES702_07696 [subsurface metagenome]